MKHKAEVNRLKQGRRRALRILATAGAMTATQSVYCSRPNPEAFTWQGLALGAKASLTLYGVDESEGRRIVEQVRMEVQRLEQMFSLYRSDSAISQLNARGSIANPPIDFLRLLSEAHAISEVTYGAFDVSVQPLWNLYANHPWHKKESSSGPRAKDVETIRSLVNYKQIDFDAGAIALRKPGMSITLNGIAQGYITDRVTELLHASGLHNVLIDLGEIRALDAHPSGRPWIVGLQSPTNPQQTDLEINIDHQAVATSSGTGTRFEVSGVHHHIFNPHSGRASNHYLSVSVVGPRAAVSDALSTGLYSLKPSQARTALGRFPEYSAYIVFADGSKQIWKT